MAPADFPEPGSQIKRNSDGLLGEVYAVYPPSRLSIRWAARLPGSYIHEDCTLEQFARAWQPTGVRMAPPRETHVAVGLIIFAVIAFFTAVLVHDRSTYSGYDPYRPSTADAPNVLGSAQALNARYGMLAAEQCADGADEYIRSVTDHRFHWEVTGDALTPRFDRFSPTVSAPGVLTLISNQARISDGFGVFNPIQISCNFDTQTREVLSYTGGNGTQ